MVLKGSKIVKTKANYMNCNISVYARRANIDLDVAHKTVVSLIWWLL